MKRVWKPAVLCAAAVLVLSSAGWAGPGPDQIPPLRPSTPPAAASPAKTPDRPAPEPGQVTSPPEPSGETPEDPPPVEVVA
jgi:hypothetical protein